MFKLWSQWSIAIIAASVLGVPRPLMAAHQPKSGSASATTVASVERTGTADAEEGQQTPPPPPPPAPAPQTSRSGRGSTPPPPPPPPPKKGLPVNVKVDAVISDQRSSSEPVRKTLSLTIGDGRQGLVRSNSVFNGGVIGGGVPLHMDATPEILPDGKIRLTFGLEYDLPRPGGPDTPGPGGPNVNRTEIREHLIVVLENGKPLVVSQSADPVSERQVTVELKATILK